jgi:hypothetical protein
VGSTLIGMAALVGWPSVAGATYSGHNGDVLVRSPAPVGLGEAGPARGADCLGFASGLWAVRADGTRPIDVGWGDSGMFSPQGLRLAITFLGDPCYGYGGGAPAGSQRRLVPLPQRRLSFAADPTGRGRACRLGSVETGESATARWTDPSLQPSEQAHRHDPADRCHHAVDLMQRSRCCPADVERHQHRA